MLGRASTLGALLAFAIIVLCVLLTLATLALAPLTWAARVLTTLVLVRHCSPSLMTVDTQEVRPSCFARLSDVERGDVKDHLRPACA